MLRKYAKIWNARFTSCVIVPQEIASRVLSSDHTTTNHAPYSAPSSSSLPWYDLLSRIYQGSMRQSDGRVPDLVQRGIPQLYMTDITLEGIDFHCSSILETSVLADQEMFTTCIDRLRQHKDDDDDVIIIPSIDDGWEGNPMPSTVDGRRSWLERLLKHCMWRYSAGVNRRRPLGNDSRKERPVMFLQQFWTEIVFPRIHAFAEQYIRDRLV